MLAVLHICGNLFLRISEKNSKIAKIRNHKNFMSHDSLPIFLAYGAALTHVSQLGYNTKAKAQ